MRSELTVPQVFEPGARVKWSGTNVPPRILSHIDNGSWIGVTVDGLEKNLGSARDVSDGLEVLAPAPRDGQRWANAVCGMMIRATTDLSSDTQKLCACFAEAAPPLVIADTVYIARWLLEHGYSYAGPADAAPATLRASEAAAVEPTPATAPPAPWTLTAARRLIAETIASAKPRRPDAFTAAMCSMAEDETPHASVILAAGLAICCLEEDLPEHGAPAAWQKDRARVLAEDVFRNAAQLEHVPARVREAFEMYVARRN